MTTIYLLGDDALADAGALESKIRGLTGGRYEVESFSDTGSLEELLKEVCQAVVVFAAPPEQIGTTVHRFRNILPGTGCVAVVPDSDWMRTPVLETDCHFLRRPFDDFSVLTQISAAARQAELLTTLAGSAQLDEVTNLFNRRYFIKRLSEEISLARRHLSPLCVVVLGVNYYRMYLDSYGYEFINGLLCFLGERLHGLTRTEDIIARIGDDEIGILLPRSTEKGAKIFTNRLVLTLNALTYAHNGYEEEVSVCAGVAGFPLPDDSPADADTVIRYGRHALHQARCAPDEHVRVQLFSEIKPAL